MTREERHALVLKLKAEGLSLNKIAERVGISSWKQVAFIIRKAQEQQEQKRK